jgi:hypothetical protein
MKIFCTASKDNYITNKVISGVSKTNCNLGMAGTLDLFKLYDSNNLIVNNGIEISRLLIKFDLERIKNLLNTKIDLNDDSFKASIKLFDVDSGIPKPAKFNLEVLPLNVNFDEGIGRDVASYGDFDASNFLDANYSNGTNQPWFLEGANAKGYANDDADVIIGIESKLFNFQQRFETGEEDLNIDVTTAVSGVLSGELPDHGFRISFVQEQEEDNRTRLLKRFASRHVVNPQIRPRLEITFDDSDYDDRANLSLDQNCKLMLENRIAGTKNNINVLGTDVVGNNCLSLDISYGSMLLHFSGSQKIAGTYGNAVDGTYESIINIPSDEIVDPEGTTIFDELQSKRRLELEERWYSPIYPSRTIKKSKIWLHLKEPNGSMFGNLPYELNLFNLKESYSRSSIERVRVFVYDPTIMYGPTRKKTLRLQSAILSNVHYSIRDVNSNLVVMDYDFDRGSTRASYDSEGLYFDVDMASLPVGRTYSFDFCVFDGDNQYNYRSKESFGVF